jgi:hypothetical protein
VTEISGVLAGVDVIDTAAPLQTGQSVRPTIPTISSKLASKTPTMPILALFPG